ncbi:MAG TPA: hypothetical protein VHY83_04225 [Solirubrobacteraceae bacterium]|jgi:hypothetical protein|nr:hypothetical protein [Solirubrobacteraceae bacterium]
MKYRETLAGIVWVDEDGNEGLAKDIPEDAVIEPLPSPTDEEVQDQVVRDMGFQPGTPEATAFVEYLHAKWEAEWKAGREDEQHE